MRSVALLLVIATTACYPHNARNRRIAKWSEGGAIAGGIAFLAVSGSGADCKDGPVARSAYADCRHHEMIVGDIGLALVLGGLVGFGITQLMTPEAAPPPPSALAATPDPDAPRPTLPAPAAKRLMPSQP